MWFQMALQSGDKSAVKTTFSVSKAPLKPQKRHWNHIYIFCFKSAVETSKAPLKPHLHFLFQKHHWNHIFCFCFKSAVETIFTFTFSVSKAPCHNIFTILRYLHGRTHVRSETTSYKWKCGNKIGNIGCQSAVPAADPKSQWNHPAPRMFQIKG